MANDELERHGSKVDLRERAFLARLHRAATRALQSRGVVFVDRGPVQPSEKGALTQVYLGAVTFELVVSHLKP